MKVLVVEPGYAPYEKDIEGLHGMQEVVIGRFCGYNELCV